MKIIERQLIGKHTQSDCEDGIVVTPHFVAVIDGSTSKTSHRFNADMSNGHHCMKMIANFIRKMKIDILLDDFCDQITEIIRSEYLANGNNRLENQIINNYIPPHERLCASVVIYSEAHRQIWMIGDCQAMVDGQLHENGKPYEASMAARRAACFRSCQLAHNDMTDGLTIVHDYARDAILPHLIKAMDGQNKTFAVIDGYPIFRDGIKVISIDKNLSEIVLASDGYPMLKSTLAESEATLSEQLARDPFNIGDFKATKGLMRGNHSFDDRAYVRFLT